MKRYILALAAMAALLGSRAEAQGKFSGLMFGDYFYNVQRDSGLAALSNVATNGTKDFQGFQFRRIYFTYDADLAEQFAMRFRLEADQSAQFASKTFGAVVKDAYLKWKGVFGRSDLIFGIQPTPAFDVSEGFWGYRSLEKTIMDLRGIVSSRDFGVALKGKLDEEGMFGYWLMFGNGDGNKPATSKYKRYYAHVQIKPTKTLLVTVYADLKSHAPISNPYSATTPRQGVSNNTLTTAGFIGFSGIENLTLAAEGFYASTSNGYDNGTSLAARNAIGFTLLGKYALSPELTLIARYDRFDPNSNSSAKGDSRDYVIAGLSWKAAKNVEFIPNLLYEKYESIPNGRSIDPSVTARVTTYFTF